MGPRGEEGGQGERGARGQVCAAGGRRGAAGALVGRCCVPVLGCERRGAAPGGPGGRSRCVVLGCCGVLLCWGPCVGVLWCVIVSLCRVGVSGCRGV